MFERYIKRMGKNPRKLYNIFVFSAFPKIGKKKSYIKTLMEAKKNSNHSKIYSEKVVVLYSNDIYIIWEEGIVEKMGKKKMYRRKIGMTHGGDGIVKNLLLVFCFSA